MKHNERIIRHTTALFFNHCIVKYNFCSLSINGPGNFSPFRRIGVNNFQDMESLLNLPVLVKKDEKRSKSQSFETNSTRRTRRLSEGSHTNTKRFGRNFVFY